VRRGIPVVFPLLDITDRATVNVSDVSGMFDDQIRAASVRYAADEIMAGHMLQVMPGLWEGRWRLLTAAGRISWSNGADSREALLEEAVGSMVDALSDIYMPADATLANVFIELTVSDIAAVGDYARSMDYLSRLAMVDRLHVAHVMPGSVTFQLWVRGGRRAIEQAISLGKTLAPALDGGDLSYRLLP